MNKTAADSVAASGTSEVEPQTDAELDSLLLEAIVNEKQIKKKPVNQIRTSYVKKEVNRCSFEFSLQLAKLRPSARNYIC